MSNSLQISALEATGGLVSTKPVQKTIDWYKEVDGELVPEKFVVHVLKLSYTEMEDIAQLTRGRTAAFVARGILFDNGETKLTQEQADRLNPELIDNLVKVFNEVNSKPGKASLDQKKSSGTK